MPKERARFRSCFRQIAGMPDYAAYLERAREGPGGPPLSEREYYDQYIALRYANGGWRCC